LFEKMPAVDFEPGEVMAGLRLRALALTAETESIAVAIDESESVDPRALEALRRSGLTEVTVPGSYGGLFEEVDPLAICIVREALAGHSSHLDSLFAMQGIGSFALTIAGTEEQRARWLPAVCSMDAIAGLALTEPEAGSDLKIITTRLTPNGSGYRVDGAKSFISNGGDADFYVTLVAEDSGLSLVLVPSTVAGLHSKPTPALIAPHAISDLVFDGVEIPESARIGARGRGLEIALSTLAVFRASVGAAAVGMAQRALDEAVIHTTTRVQFGKTLIRHGEVAALLADSWTEIEMARLLVYRAACRARQDPLAALTDSSMAKLAASEMASRVIDRCLQVSGRFGLIRDSVIGRLYRQARALRIYEGSSEVLKANLARALSTGAPRGAKAASVRPV
jgi:acyl-CoA dehydrogenase